MRAIKSYITMSMPLLYNIKKINNALTIQSSVSMQTDVYSVILLSITEGTTRLVSPDLNTQFVRPSDPMAFRGLSAHVPFCS